MQSPLPQLMTILLLVHLGLGCCLHHSHACELDGQASADGCETHFHLPAAARKECEEPAVGLANEEHHSHDCSVEDCTFIAYRPRLVSEIEEASHLSSLVVQMLGHPAMSSRDTSYASGTAPEHARTSLPRTHLTLQVWQL